MTDERAGALEGHREWRDLVAIGLIALLGALAPAIPGLARVPIGVLAVLLAPGYALVVALFEPGEPFELVERLALSLGASLALIPVQALLLNVAPGGLRPDSIRFAVTACTLLFLVAAIVRRRRAPSTPVWSGGDAPGGTKVRVVRFTQAVVLANLLVAALAFALTVGDPPAPSTEFYVLGRDGLLASYPRAQTIDAPLVVRVGVRQGAGPGRYSITARAGDRVVATFGPIAVQPGATWEDELRLTLDTPGPDRSLELLLENEGEERPLRTLRLWIDVAGSGA